ncbi:MAG TPA: FlgD immunoglobulin-like domain containing protein, partial [Bacteroidota bacterium]
GFSPKIAAVNPEGIEMIEEELSTEAAHPETFTFEQNHPNPFNPETVIRYSLPEQSIVNLRIYDMLGREVRALVEEKQNAGSHSLVWDGNDGTGNQLASGVYVYRFVVTPLESKGTKSFVTSKKMVLMR